MPAQFNMSAVDADAVAQLRQHFGLPNFIAQTMVARGISTVEQAELFLTPSLERDWRNPYDIPNMDKVVDALEAAVKERKSIVVFGDFDVDGISATAVLTRGLRALGARATPFIPRRFEDGYGLSMSAFERLKDFEPELIVTTDCGIASKNEVAEIIACGVDVVVTDHHEPADLVPEGVPVVDPKMQEGLPSAVLAGVGVALKVVQALGARFGFPHLWRSYTDLATLGTVADLMPMVGENRALVTDGLERINNMPRPCIAALLGRAGASGKPVTATNMSFSLVPRLNAAGRMGDAQAALDLLMTDDYELACQLAASLEEINDRRRAIEAELSEFAREKAIEVYHGQRALVVAGEGWHEGVKGIVASRLVHSYGVPCLLFTIDGDEAHGSGRTIGQVNLFEAVASAEDLLTRFGGHEAAVGVTLPTANLDAFAERLCEYMDKLPDDAFHPMIEIDATVSLDELTIENVEKLEILAPFGQENKVPCLLARDVTVSNGRAVGAEKNHFSCVLSDGTNRVSGIMFHCSDIEMLMNNTSVVNAAFEAQVDEWRGRRSVKAMLKSLAPSTMCAALKATLDPQGTSFVSDLFAVDDDAFVQPATETPEDVESYEADRAANRVLWNERAKSDPDGLEEAVIAELIGDSELHDSQRQALDYLRRNESLLTVMATGRGKSLIFYVHAAVIALRDHKTSVFVYPLRALVNDQAFHLNNAFARFGLSIEVLCGTTTREERARIYRMLDEGKVDVVLTTPEFLVHHAARIAEHTQVAFAVIDEAHHVIQAEDGSREAYGHLGDALAKFGSPTVLALTATANGKVARRIMSELPITEAVFDVTQRPNLSVDDRRGMKSREDYLAKLVATGEKTIVYVNSRERSVAIARQLRARVPQLALMIGFYNGALDRKERARIEEMFRTGLLTTLVATSAFGEGVNIPDIRHVVLYGMPLNEIEFNQISGRVGRDGKDACVHLLYGRDDAADNEAFLDDLTPDRDTLAKIYRYLMGRQKMMGNGYFILNPVQAASDPSFGKGLNPNSFYCALSVFRELDLIDVHTNSLDLAAPRMVMVKTGHEKVELVDSVRYREGLSVKALFKTYKQQALCESASSLRNRIACPIVPACAAASEAALDLDCIESAD